MAAITTPSIILGALRYGDTSKIVRLATRDLGIRSALAKGALRPRSRFGASLQLLSEGVAHLYLKDTRDLQTLAAFDLTNLRAGLATDLPRFAAAAALGEVAWRFSPAEPHPDSFDLLSGALTVLETAPAEAVEVFGLRMLWRLVSVRGFAPALDRCARDGAPRPPDASHCVAVGSELLFEQPQLQRQRYQPLLGAVVQVPLKALAFALLGVDHAGPRSGELLDSRAQLDLGQRQSHEICHS